MLFSIIVPTCNRIEQLLNCIYKLNAHDQHFNMYEFEIIVTDDSNNFELQKILAEKFQNTIWIKGPQRGPAANRNNGVKFAKGEWLIFLDDDVIPDKNLVNVYLEAIQNNPTINAFEGAIHPDNWQLLKKDMAECPVNLTGGVFWSANICIKKGLFDDIGGFDEQFKIAAQEDQDIYNRLMKLTQVLFVSDSIVIHPVRIISFFIKIRQSKNSILNWLVYSQKNKTLRSTIYSGIKSQVLAFLSNFKKQRYKSATCCLYMLFIFPIIIFQQKVLKNV